MDISGDHVTELNAAHLKQNKIVQVTKVFSMSIASFIQIHSPVYSLLSHKKHIIEGLQVGRREVYILGPQPQCLANKIMHFCLRPDYVLGYDRWSEGK